MHIKTGDNAMVIRGRERGKKGKVMQVFPQKALVVLEGVNERTRHIRTRRSSEKGQKISFFAPLPAANVALFCEKCARARRVKNHTAADGKKQRVCVTCQTPFHV